MKQIVIIKTIIIFSSVVLGQIDISLETDKSEYQIGEPVEIYITANNLSSDSITLNFATSCQSEYYIDDFYSDTTHGCYLAVTWVTIPPESSYTWDWVHTNEYYALEEGGHSVVGEVLEGYGFSDTVFISVTSLSINNSHLIPPAFRIKQNYPNPFNARTTIEFSIPNNGLVNLSIYDIMGREIETIMNEELSAGNYSVTWNGNNVPSGVYFIRLTIEKFVQTQKVVLLK